MLEGIVGDNAYANINQSKLTNFVKPQPLQDSAIFQSIYERKRDQQMLTTKSHTQLNKLKLDKGQIEVENSIWSSGDSMATT